MTTIRLTSAAIWTGDGAPFPGHVEVAAGRVTAVIRDERAAGGSPTLLTAGLANAHTHLDLTFPRAREFAGDFTEWLVAIVELRRREGSAGLARAARAGVRSSLEAGVTLLFDFDPAGASLPALAASPLRRAVFREVIALARDRHDPGALEAFLGGGEDPARELRAIAPHAPYTVHPEVLPALVTRADRGHLPWSMHIAECAWERELLETGRGEGARFLARFEADPAEFAGGGGAVARLDAAGLLTPRALLVHGNHLDAGDIARIARSGAAVVWCPRSHAWFGHPPHPLARLLAAGVPVLLGTDGAVSAGDLELLSEMRAAARAHPRLPAEWIWRAATRAPREFLGDRLGRGIIAAGEPADLALWEVPPSGAAEPLRSVIEGGEPLATWIDGALAAGSPAGAS